jgi:hypothetical protein
VREVALGCGERGGGGVYIGGGWRGLGVRVAEARSDPMAAAVSVSRSDSWRGEGDDKQTPLVSD